MGSHRTDHRSTQDPQEQSKGTDHLEQPIEQDEPDRNGRAAKRKSTYSDAFLIWWDAYPRKVGKRAASTAYGQAVQRVQADTGSSLPAARAILLERSEAFAKSPAGQRGKYTPHPTTWLNRGSYDDDPSEWQKQEADSGRKRGDSINSGPGFDYDPEVKCRF